MGKRAATVAIMVQTSVKVEIASFFFFRDESRSKTTMASKKKKEEIKYGLRGRRLRCHAFVSAWYAVWNAKGRGRNSGSEVERKQAKATEQAHTEHMHINKQVNTHKKKISINAYTCAYVAIMRPVSCTLWRPFFRGSLYTFHVLTFWTPTNTGTRFMRIKVTIPCQSAKVNTHILFTRFCKEVHGVAGCASASIAQESWKRSLLFKMASQ